MKLCASGKVLHCSSIVTVQAEAVHHTISTKSCGVWCFTSHPPLKMYTLLCIIRATKKKTIKGKSADHIQRQKVPLEQKRRTLGHKSESNQSCLGDQSKGNLNPDNLSIVSVSMMQERGLSIYQFAPRFSVAKSVLTSNIMTLKVVQAGRIRSSGSFQWALWRFKRLFFPE